MLVLYFFRWDPSGEFEREKAVIVLLEKMELIHGLFVSENSGIIMQGKRAIVRVIAYPVLVLP